MALKIYARVSNAVVVEKITLDSTISLSSLFHPSVVAQLFETTSLDPQPQVGWTYSAGIFSPPASLSGQALKDDLKNHSGVRRFQTETAGIMVSGKPVRTDRESQSQLTAAWAMVQNDPNTTIQWKDNNGNFTTLNGQQIVQFQEAITAHVQLCFNTESDVLTQINNSTITSKTQVDAIYNNIPHLAYTY